MARPKPTSGTASAKIRSRLKASSRRMAAKRFVAASLKSPCVRREIDHQSRHLIEIGDMDDERIEEGSVFDLEDSGNGKGIESIRAQPVDRLRGEGNPPFLHDLSSMMDGFEAAEAHEGHRVISSLL